MNAAHVVPTITRNAVAARNSTKVKKFARRDETTNLRHHRGVRLVGEAVIAIVAALHRPCCIFASSKSTSRLSPTPGKALGLDLEIAQPLAKGVPIDTQILRRA